MTDNAHKKLLMMLFAALALRAVIPLGYMPGNLAAGTLVEMCPDGMPAGFVELLGGQHHHGGHDANSDSASASIEYCSMGHLLAPTAVAAGEPAILDIPRQFRPPTYFQRETRPGEFVAYLSRGPPVL